MVNRIRLCSALLGLCLCAVPTLAQNPVNDRLPPPDGKPADMSKPVKVFIIMGQSNTLECGLVNGTRSPFLTHAVQEEGLYPFMVDGEGQWTTRKDVRQVHILKKGKKSVQRNDWLSVYGNAVGIDQGIGHHLGNYFDEPVLVLRCSVGNRSLGWDYLPPGSPSWEVEETDKKTGEVKTVVYAGHGEYPAKRDKGTEPGKGKWHAGIQYAFDVSNAKKVLADIGTFYPGATQYEVAGFFWWQGCKDKDTRAYTDRYELHLSRLIEALRKDHDAPKAKFVAASLGETPTGAKGGDGKILEAVMNVADPKKYPQYKGSVAGVYAHPLTIPAGQSCGHYGGSAKTYMNVGLAMGEAMVELFKRDP